MTGVWSVDESMCPAICALGMEYSLREIIATFSIESSTFWCIKWQLCVTTAVFTHSVRNICDKWACHKVKCTCWVEMRDTSFRIFLFILMQHLNIVITRYASDSITTWTSCLLGWTRPPWAEWCWSPLDAICSGRNNQRIRLSDLLNTKLSCDPPEIKHST